MRKINLFDLSVAGVVERFYLMMAVIVIPGFFDQFILAAILGFTVGVSFILGISFTETPEKLVAKELSKTDSVKLLEISRKNAA